MILLPAEVDAIEYNPRRPDAYSCIGSDFVPSARLNFLIIFL